MIGFEHLTKQQLSDYTVGSLEQSVLHEVGRHLLGCSSCRANLPHPTRAGFREALFSESGNENSGIVEESQTWAEMISRFIETLRRNSNLALAGSALILLVSLSLVYLVKGPLRSDRGDELATSVETQSGSPELSHDTVDSVEAPKSTKENRPWSESGKSKSWNLKRVTGPDQKLGLGTTNSSSRTRNGSIPAPKRQSISSTRGSASKCGDTWPIGFEFAVKNASVVLNWEKVPKAVKYHLYISDDDEILIDEYETTEKTSYVFAQTLDNDKNYKWKVVIELEGGRTMVGVSQKFTAKDLRLNQKGYVKRLNAEIRCTASN